LRKVTCTIQHTVLNYKVIEPSVKLHVHACKVEIKEGFIPKGNLYNTTYTFIMSFIIYNINESNVTMYTHACNIHPQNPGYS